MVHLNDKYAELGIQMFLMRFLYGAFIVFVDFSFIGAAAGMRCLTRS